jgi:YesN/AraC family two-component response regulator
VVILVVDDEIPICELLEEFLSQLGHKVITANTGEEAIMKFHESRPNAVFLDIRMPGISGIEVIKKLREIDNEPSIVMLSGFGEFSVIQEAYKTGANYYIQKPIELDRIVKILDSLKN